MKKVLFLIIVMPALMWGCASRGTGELIGVQGRFPWF